MNAHMKMHDYVQAVLYSCKKRVQGSDHKQYIVWSGEATWIHSDDTMC